MPAPGRLEVGEFEQAALVENQVLVRTHWAGICGSDVHVVHHGFHLPDLLGHPGYPGHEGVGVVVESRSRAVPVGSRVLTVPSPIDRAGGSFAEFQTVSPHELVPLPADVDLAQMLFAQQMGTVLFALKRFVRAEDPPHTAAILGAGPVGLFFLQLLRRAGTRTVVVAEPQPLRRQWAKRLGATTVHDCGIAEPRESAGDHSHNQAEAQIESQHIDPPLTEVVEGLVPGGVDLVVEASGTDAARKVMADLVRIRGVVGVFGYPSRTGLAPFPVHQAFRKALSVEFLSGTQAEPGLTSFHTAVDLIAAGALPLAHLRQDVFTLPEIDRAVSAAAGAEPIVKATVDLRPNASGAPDSTPTTTLTTTASTNNRRSHDGTAR